MLVQDLLVASNVYYFRSVAQLLPIKQSNTVVQVLNSQSLFTERTSRPMGKPRLLVNGVNHRHLSN